MSILVNRIIGVAASSIVVAASLAVPVAQAATCQAHNATSGGAASADLQAVIDAAAAGDTIHVTGTCTGGFTIDKDLRVSRDPEQRRPTLDGAGAATVLTVIGTAEAPVTVVLNGLRITGGHGKRGAGLRNLFGHVRLNASVVSGNLATKSGGGIFSRGRLTLFDARVAANTTPGPGGGMVSRGQLKLKGETTIIDNQGDYGGGILAIGTVELFRHSAVVRNTGGGISYDYPAKCRITMNGSSTVRGNTGVEAGGIAGCTPVVMNDRSSVRRNHGRQAAGMVVNNVIMNDRAIVAGNTSRNYGGGIYAYRVVMNDHARIVRNTARRDGGGVYGGRPSGTAVRMNGHSAIASNTANRGGGIYALWSDVILHDQASVTRNVAKSTGGGVLLYSWRHCPGKVGQLVTRDQATISKNTPNNVVKRNDVVDCSV